MRTTYNEIFQVIGVSFMEVGKVRPITSQNSKYKARLIEIVSEFPMGAGDVMIVNPKE